MLALLDRTVNAETKGETERKRGRAYASVPRQGKAERKREMAKARDEEGMREGGRGRKGGSQQPAAPSAADRFIEWHVPIRSNVVLYFSALGREQRLGERAKSPAGWSTSRLGPPPPPARKPRSVSSPSVGAIPVFFRFEHSSMILAVPKAWQGERERRRKRERENYGAAISATWT